MSYWNMSSRPMPSERVSKTGTNRKIRATKNIIQGNDNFTFIGLIISRPSLPAPGSLVWDLAGFYRIKGKISIRVLANRAYPTNRNETIPHTMAHVSHKLKNAVEGALAGGGDPATSPLYVFGPFLKLIVVAGVAQVTFGASVWMVILTIAVVSAMYRLVMRWVTDGSGGSGLSEEEFGGWAVKVNAAITFIEYTLTFLVSMSAMVTFIADRIPVLNNTFLWMQYRTILAIALSILTGWLVNRGPKVAARAFGPATAGVLMLLWMMVIATIWETGFHLPKFDLRAFQPEYIGFTINGYARILAVMTGIEVFANLVAAYDGDAAQKSKKAFTSLLIIMGTTGITMLIVGPAIFQLSDPTDPARFGLHPDHGPAPARPAALSGHAGRRSQC